MVNGNLIFVYRNIDLEARNDISANDEKLGASDIDAAELSDLFKMKLLAGTIEKNTFIEIPPTRSVDVGTVVNIRLQYEDSDSTGYK